MRIVIICSVRGASDEYRASLEQYVDSLEAAGHQVHLPHRDVDQQSRGIDICRAHRSAMKECDEVRLFYTDPTSQGTHFDMGMAFAFEKPIVVVENVPHGPEKSFGHMAEEWAEENS